MPTKRRNATSVNPTKKTPAPVAGGRGGGDRGRGDRGKSKECMFTIVNYSSAMVIMPINNVDICRIKQIVTILCPPR